MLLCVRRASRWGELYPNPNLSTLTLTRRQVGELYLEPLLKELAGSGPGVTGKKD